MKTIAKLPFDVGEAHSFGAVVDAGLERTLELGLYPFVPGDALKLNLAGALLPAAWRLVGGRARP